MRRLHAQIKDKYATLYHTCIVYFPCDEQYFEPFITRVMKLDHTGNAL